MNILVTGAAGFIGKNLVARLRELDGCEVFQFFHGDSEEKLVEYIQKSDWIIHLAGVNRPSNVSEFHTHNGLLP